MVLAPVVLAPLLGAAPARAELPFDPVAVHRRLQEWRCAPAVRVPADGVRWAHGAAQWSLVSGELRWLEPAPGGPPTGFVFEGRGRFLLRSVDPFEWRQLRRFARQPDLEVLDQSFDRLVVRAAGAEPGLLLAALAADLPGGKGAAGDCPLARERHLNWLVQRSLDVDARLVWSLLDPAVATLRAEARTADHGWLAYDVDSTRREEIRLERFTTSPQPYTETWLSYGQGPSGAAYDLERIEVSADLSASGREARLGISDVNEARGRFTTAVTVRAVAARLAAARFELHPEAKVERVTDGAGVALPFLRDAVGERSPHLHDYLYDEDLIVVLDPPLAAGERRRLAVAYELNLGNYAPGRLWYPAPAEHLYDRHLATLELVTPAKREVRAMGRLASSADSAGRRTTVWEVEKATPMVTFSVVDSLQEATAQAAGGPEVTVFSSRKGVRKSVLQNTAADLANCTAFLTALLRAPLAAPRIVATAILGGHGQAFEGFLHLSEDSFDEQRAGREELFRCHEAAHQWWGHEVGFATYRDQWWSEALAEYSAMLFVESAVEDGPRLFQEILDVYAGELEGSIRGRMSRFSRPWLTELNDRYRERIGPLVLGHRASTAEVPRGYTLQAYRRGPWVLHMLRRRLREESGSDERFFSLLRDFAARHRQGEATTADLRAAVERAAPGDWGEFFERWVEGTEPLPTSRYSKTPR